MLKWMCGFTRNEKFKGKKLIQILLCEYIQQGLVFKKLIIKDP